MGYNILSVWTANKFNFREGYLPAAAIYIYIYIYGSVFVH